MVRAVLAPDDSRPDPLEPGAGHGFTAQLVRCVARALFSSFLALSCNAPTEPSAGEHLRAEPAWLVGAALEALGSDGRFDFVDPLPPAEGELSREESLELAKAVIRFYTVAVGGGREYIEQEEHGGPIDWPKLTHCGRRIIPWFTNLEASDPVPSYVANPLSSRYLIEFCSPSGVRSVRVWIPVTSQARVRPDGLIEFPNPGGGSFIATGIPLRPRTDASPEYGAALVHERVGVRISSVPELDGCLWGIRICVGSIGWHWKYVLERPIRVRLESGSVVETGTVYTQPSVLDSGTLFVASETQPEPMWLQYTIHVPGSPGVADSVLVMVVRPLRLERFELVQ